MERIYSSEHNEQCYGYFLLLLAVLQVGNIHAANALISFGADLDCLNIFDQTPLDIAMDHNHDEMHRHLRSLDGQTGMYVRQRVDSFVKLEKAPLLGAKKECQEEEEKDVVTNMRQLAYRSLERAGSVDRAEDSYSAWLEWKRRRASLREKKAKQKPSCNTPPVFHLKDGHRVLCLDGGGIRGLIQVEVLSHLEEATGRRIPELFDWIVGTSTGGIVALAMVYGECGQHVSVVNICGLPML